MLPEGTHIIVAVSGGSDSVCLLHVLRELGHRVTGVAHFNHKLRGEASDQDEQFVAELARALGLPFYVASAPVGSLAGNLEQNARQARRKFFKELLGEGHATRIALGHTRDDQAETVLFRLLRGSGVSGLAGILPITAEGIVRPLLGVSKAEVVAYLHEHNLRWREDATNGSAEFARNRIRKTLLPQLKRDWNPAIEDALANLADVAYEEEVWWASEIAELANTLFQVREGSVEFCVSRLASLDRGRLRRLIRHAIRRVKGNLRGIEFDHIERIIELAAKSSGSARVTLPGIVVIRSFDWILVAKPSAVAAQVQSIRVQAPGLYGWPPRNPLIQIQLGRIDPAENAYATLGLSLVGLELRGWRPGDWYQPRGCSRETKIKELFQRARIPSWRRLSWPILTGEGKILWAKEFGPAAGASGLQVREIPLDV